MQKERKLPGLSANATRPSLGSPWSDVSLFVIPLLVLVVGLLVTRGLGGDRVWADLLYQIEGGHWTLRHAWITSRVLHEYGQRFSIAWGVGLLALTIWAAFGGVLHKYLRGLVCLCIAVLASLLLVSLSKHMIPLPCPWDLQRYGGDVAGQAYDLYPGQVSGCFPAGHAAGGYCLVALYFFARVYAFRRQVLWLLPAVIVGLTYGLTQELRGAHFLSHDIVSAALCWFVSYGVFRSGFPLSAQDKQTARLCSNSRWETGRYPTRR